MIPCVSYVLLIPSVRNCNANSHEDEGKDFTFTGCVQLSCFATEQPVPLQLALAE